MQVELPPLPKCPSCENNKTLYLNRQVQMAVEDTTRPKIPQPPGAGVTHPAYQLVQLRATTCICRECGCWFWDPKGFVSSK